MSSSIHASEEQLVALRDAALSKAYISLGRRRTDTPHEFYRYPARFSPQFAEAAIKCFTSPGELVLDPFVGGGTTVVEAYRLGRPSVAADLNPLATFVTEVKTTHLSDSDQASVRGWLQSIHPATNTRIASPDVSSWTDGDYFRHLNRPDTWRYRKVISLAIDSIPESSAAVEAFCRSIVLRTSQWALDMRSELPSLREFRDSLVGNGLAMLEAMRKYNLDLPADVQRPIVLHQGLPGLAGVLSASRTPKPRLVLTSPPYPGVYVNYHRWKLLGRKEIRAPYWIADRRDGNGLAYYTMAARSEPTLNTYFGRLTAAFKDLRRVCNTDTLVVQVVGFNNPDIQLDRYLDTMTNCGFDEIRIAELATEPDGRLWREVPGRRWWTQANSLQSSAPHTSHEVVLLHQPAD